VSINPAVSSSLRGAKPGDDFVQVIDDQVAAADAAGASCWRRAPTILMTS
jgi:hypothetical protein